MNADNNSNPQLRKAEIFTFLFLAVFLAPMLTIAGVAGYGLVLWLLQ